MSTPEIKRNGPPASPSPSHNRTMQRNALNSINNNIQFPPEADRVQYWKNYLSLDHATQVKLKDDRSFIIHVWAGIPDELRAKVWTTAIATFGKATQIAMQDNAKQRFTHQLDPIFSHYNLYSPHDKQLSAQHLQTIRMVLRFAATSLEQENYIEGTFQLLGATMQYIPTLTQSIQLFQSLYHVMKILWLGSLLEEKAIQRFIITTLFILHRDCPSILFKLSTLGLDVSDLHLFARQWVFALGAQHFPFALTHRIIDILLLDQSVGIAALSGIFMGMLLHFHEITGITPDGRFAANTNPATPGAGLSYNDFANFPYHPHLDPNQICFLGYQYFRDRYPAVEVAFLQIIWKSLLLHNRGFSIWDNPCAPKNDSALKSSLTPSEKQILYRDLLPSTLMPNSDRRNANSPRSLVQITSPLGGYNSLPLRLSDVGKIFDQVNLRWNRKKQKLLLSHRKNAQNIIAMVDPSVDDARGDIVDDNNSSQQSNGPGSAGVVVSNKNGKSHESQLRNENTEKLKQQLTTFRQYISLLAGDLRRLPSLANGGTGGLVTSTSTLPRSSSLLGHSKDKHLHPSPQQQQHDDRLLYNTSVNTTLILQEHIDPILQTLNDRVSLHLHDLPSIPASPLEFSNTTEHVQLQVDPKYNPNSAEYSGFIKYTHLPYFLLMPCVSMEGYLFKAFYELTSEGNSPNTHKTPTSSPQGTNKSYTITHVTQPYFVIKGPFLMEYDSPHSQVPYKERCTDIRNLKIVADKSGQFRYGYGIGLFNHDSIVLQLYSPRETDFKRWLATLSAAIALPRVASQVDKSQ